jgi:UDP-2,4-diacetamido-2,4,6-trideoxy-beta-L-altropyranose hydrolase
VIVRLRRATEADCTLLWHWVNDPAVRTAAFHADPIPWSDHLQWFESRVHSDRSVIFIAEAADGTPVGQVRFDVNPGESAEVDISVAREWRGRGLAAQILRLACDGYQAQAADTLVARIRPGNVASLRAFERAEFQQTGTDRVADCEALRLERQSRPVVASR